MVLLTLTKKINGVIGPFIMRHGLSARHVLLRGRPVDSPYIDMLFLLRYAQTIISHKIYDDSALFVSTYKQKSGLDAVVDRTFEGMFGKYDEEIRREKSSISQLRLEVLDENIRPALISNDLWADVVKWRSNPRVVKWARTEFLVSKYGPEVKDALDAYPQLRASPQLSGHPTRRMILDLLHGRSLDFEKYKNKKTFLPSSETIIKAFNMRHWEKRKNSKSIRHGMVEITEKIGGVMLKESHGNILNFAEIPMETNLYDFTMEDILEVTGGHVIHCGAFNAVCEEADIYQMWTTEYVSTLGRYLLDRSINYTDGETIILDIGAGDGLLVKFLNEYMASEFKNLSSKRKINKSKSNQQSSTRSQKTRAAGTTKMKPPAAIATDDGSWGIFAKADVEKLNVEDAIAKYATNNGNSYGDDDDDDNKNSNKRRQIIVLCSWMPMGQDWTALFRKYDIDEYILIGEADDGTCGHNWKTWGNPSFLPTGSSEGDDTSIQDETNDTTIEPPIPSYTVDGYERWDMETLSKYQFSRFDCAVSRSSKTVSFKKAGV